MIDRYSPNRIQKPTPAPNVVGMKLSEAQKVLEGAGFDHRISAINGRGMMVTADMHFWRVNLGIESKDVDVYKNWEKSGDCIVVSQDIG